MSQLNYWAIPKDVMADPSLTASAKLIYAILATRMNGKNFAWPSLDSLASDTGISKNTAVSAVELLVEKGLVIKKRRGSGLTNTYGLPDETEESESQKLVFKNHKNCDSRITKTVIPSIDQKNQSKTSIENPTPLPPPAGSQVTETAIAAPSGAVEGVNELFKVFYDTVNPGIKFGNKTVRKDAEWLIQKYGLSEIVRLAKWACSIQGQPYAPTIGTPSQLREKLLALQAFAKRNSESKVITI